MKKANITHWDELPLILNVKEAAQLTGCGEQTIRMLCHAKEIPCFRPGAPLPFRVMAYGSVLKKSRPRKYSNKRAEYFDSRRAAISWRSL